MSQHPQKEVQGATKTQEHSLGTGNYVVHHQVAFRLPLAARRPYGFPVPTVPVTQNALSPLAAPVTTNRPLSPILYVFYSAVSGHQHCSLMALVVCLLSVCFFASPSPHRINDSFLSFLLKFNRGAFDWTE